MPTDDVAIEDRWVQVRNCNWLHEAEFVKSVLESVGIEASIPDEYLLGAAPAYVNAIGGARVLVRAGDLQRATEILNSATGSV